MAPDQRVVKAFKAMKALGISHEEVKPVLKELLRVYDKNWEPIEEDNYRTLIDAYFEFKEDERAERERKAPVSHDGGRRATLKLNLADEDDQISLTMDNSSDDIKMPLEVPVHEVIEPSRTSMRNMKPGTNPHESHTMLSEVKMTSNSLRMAVGDTKSSSEGLYEEPICEPRHAYIQRKNMHSDHCKKEIVKSKTENLPQQGVAQCQMECFHFLNDITKGSERVKISLIDEIGNEDLPKFNYIPHNIIYQSANVNISLARIVDEDCCSDCSGDCLSLSLPCACSQETGGEFAYTPRGLLKEEFLRTCMLDPLAHRYVYCHDCPLERSKNEYKPEACKGHPVRKFIKECWRKCGCDMQCGNRVVQRGLGCKLQVFLTREGKGWGLRTLEDLPMGSFICEYVGEILTNMELYERIMNSGSDERHTYPVTLDADWGSERVLKDEEALCLDATYNGNVARFINHRCSDANLIDIPVEVETPDRHYYHLAFFTTTEVSAYEELTWDYGIDFDDHDHPIQAFQCRCGSPSCRDKKRKGKKTTGKRVRELSKPIEATEVDPHSTTVGTTGAKPYS
ncbi:hypothetical protein L6164_010600 [Bauhinia variegata]|uniref:Uncharacterized protein n=1 Tax=Bauhinia variegata TaxID=167791 RepID=A0ACB9PNH4_BAUVA|nr:hypothetical protein L6164_010600 [Bauhinia variegata]